MKVGRIRRNYDIYLMNKLSLLLFIIGFSSSAFCQNNFGTQSTEQSFNWQWSQIESSLKNKKYTEAASIADSAYRNATASENYMMAAKAQLYTFRIIRDSSDEPNKDLLIFSESQIKNSKFPFNAIWQSITAKMYWNYYLENRAAILERPQIGREVVLEDLDEWDADRYYDKIASLFLKSISHIDPLLLYSTKDFAPLFFNEDSDFTLTPTLFDMLAFRALDFLESGRSDGTLSESPFRIEDPNAFAPAEAFVSQKFQTKDLASYSWLSLQWYKQLLIAHEDDSDKSAYIDANLRRLAYVYKHSELQDKQILYKQALEYVEQNYPNYAISTKASYTIASILAGYDITSARNNVDDELIFSHLSKNPSDIAEAVEKLKNIILQFPNIYTAQQSKKLLSIIENKHIEFETERTILPGQYSKFLLKYRNVDKIHIKIVPVSDMEYRKRNQNEIAAWYKNILKKTAISSFSETLPGSGDHFEHSTEIKIDPLSQGTYALLVSLKSNFSTDSNIVIGKIFQASSLMYIKDNSKFDDYSYIVNRESGEPVSHANVFFFKENETKIYHEKVKTHRDGAFHLKAGKNENIHGHLCIVHEKDTLWDIYETGAKKFPESEFISTVFYTNNSTYRTGDSVHFIGLTAHYDRFEYNNQVMDGGTTNVELQDMNGNVLNKVKLDVDEYGSFSGSVVLPPGISGQLLLINEHGQKQIEVTSADKDALCLKLAPPHSSYKLDEHVVVKGLLKNLLGKNVENGEINYSVYRYPDNSDLYNQFAWPENISKETEIEKGTTKTDKDGRFNIRFKTTPDYAINRQSSPVFRYVVKIRASAGVQQSINSELIIRADYPGVHLFTDLPRSGVPSDFRNIKIRAQDLNGNITPVKCKIRITKLHTPALLLRKRLWPEPDYFILDSIKYKSFFPHDEYRGESNPENWTTERIILDTIRLVDTNNALSIDHNTELNTGWYRITVTSLDSKQTQAEKSSFFEIWNGKDPDVADDPLFVYVNDSAINDNRLLGINIISCLDTCIILKTEENTDRQKTIEKLNYTGKPLKWNRQITDLDGTTRTINLVTVKNNRLYQRSIPFNFLNKNNDLIVVPKIRPTDTISKADPLIFKIIRKDSTKIAAESFVFTTDIDKTYTVQKQNITPPDTLYGWENFWSTDNEILDNNNLYSFDKKISNDTGNTNYDKLLAATEKSSFFNLRTKPGAGTVSLRTGLAENPPPNSAKKGFLRNKRKKKSHKPVSEKELEALKNMRIDEYKSYYTDELFLDSTYNIKKTNFEVNSFKGTGQTNIISPFVANSIAISNISNLDRVKTDTAGICSIKIKSEDTSLKVRLLLNCHSKNIETAIYTVTLICKKAPEVITDLPEYFGEGDTIFIRAELSDSIPISDTASFDLHLFDPDSKYLVDSIFHLSSINMDKPLTNSRKNKIWKIVVPGSPITPVLAKMDIMINNHKTTRYKYISTKRKANFDQERLPYLVSKGDTLLIDNEFSGIDKSRLTTESKEIKPQIIEITSSTIWPTIQWLAKKLTHGPESNLEICNRLYESVACTVLLKNNPDISSILHKWREDYVDSATNYYATSHIFGTEGAGFSDDPFLKNEYCEKYAISTIFDSLNLKKITENCIAKLITSQKASGGFPWFKGMETDPRVTLLILHRLGRLRSFFNFNNSILDSLSQQALDYADKQIRKDYDSLFRHSLALNNYKLSDLELQYLETRSYYKDVHFNKNNIPAIRFFLKQAINHIDSMPVHQQTLIATTLLKLGDSITYIDKINQIKAKAYELNNKRMDPKLAQTSKLIISDSNSIRTSLMYTSLLLKDPDTILNKKLQQTLFSILGFEKLSCEDENPEVFDALALNSTSGKISSSNIEIRSGTELFDLYSDQKDKDITFNYLYNNQNKINKNNSISEIRNYSDNDLYCLIKLPESQSFSQPLKNDKIIHIKKTIYSFNNNNRGAPLKLASQLKTGEKIAVRLEIKIDQPIDYVRISDFIPPCFETRKVFSGYKNQESINYYESLNNDHIDYFVNHMNAGIYTFEYTLNAANAGSYKLAPPAFSSLNKNMQYWSGLIEYNDPGIIVKLN